MVRALGAYNIMKKKRGIEMSYRVYGALGFGLGGLIVGFSGDYMIFSFIIMGAIGSAFLTIPAKNTKLTFLASILGGIGFFIGFTIPMFISMTIYELPFQFLFIGLFMGLIGGFMLGIGFKNIKDFLLFSTIGFGISFGLGFGLMELWRTLFPNLFSVIVMMFAGAIGGAFLGHAAFLSKNKPIK